MVVERPVDKVGFVHKHYLVAHLTIICEDILHHAHIAYVSDPSICFFHQLAREGILRPFTECDAATQGPAESLLLEGIVPFSNEYPIALPEDSYHYRSDFRHFEQVARECCLF